ncbi:hypothetical protein CDD82_2849 [Ophiocordyceps australis]|uniref:ABC transporter domain-containing protein n=1 Tax=Ophiocordyceps australis TaxID=1399860 RepID=A0A2C5YYR1_9HYPO|nr:hypothetical protein CDD82_2849 [Ophiocordyceps australis]
MSTAGCTLQGSNDEEHLQNTSVQNITWDNVTVTVRDRRTKEPKVLLDGINGMVQAGECCALMGPSGCGKSTLLSLLSRRPIGAKVESGQVLVNGTHLSDLDFRSISCFVEQDDNLTGALTVSETVMFSSLLSNKRDATTQEHKFRCLRLLASFGLEEQAEQLVGVAFRKGISGGQKRRLSVASQLITGPKILFLDEPTSGLDSVASYEVISYISTLARRYNLIVICAIHQPSAAVLSLFGKVMLMSRGTLQYFGANNGLVEYYKGIGIQIPQHVNPAEYILETISTNFSNDQAAAIEKVSKLHYEWKSSSHAQQLKTAISTVSCNKESLGPALVANSSSRPGLASRILILLRQSFIKSYRDFVVYGIRYMMYICLAIVCGTNWLKLKSTQYYIQLFGSLVYVCTGFMAFMAFAYVPAFLEDYGQFLKARRNGIYGATEFIASNFIVGVPYIFIIAVSNSAINYWLSGLTPTTEAFFEWTMWQFFNVLAAESQIVLLTSLGPNFVIALVLQAIIMLVWLIVGGFIIMPHLMNRFWKFFYYWCFVRFPFEGMLRTQFKGRLFDCDSTCHCMYPSPMQSECKIPGEIVLQALGVKDMSMAKGVGIMLAITLAFRLASWMILLTKK